MGTADPAGTLEQNEVCIILYVLLIYSHTICMTNALLTFVVSSSTSCHWLFSYFGYLYALWWSVEWHVWAVLGFLLFYVKVLFYVQVLTYAMKLYYKILLFYNLEWNLWHLLFWDKSIPISWHMHACTSFEGCHSRLDFWLFYPLEMKAVPCHEILSPLS